jgi:hypothetical protein
MGWPKALLKVWRLDSSNPAIFIDETYEKQVKVNANKSVSIIEELEELQVQLLQERSINESRVRNKITKYFSKFTRSKY